jgi:hypothetical protein
MPWRGSGAILDLKTHTNQDEITATFEICFWIHTPDRTLNHNHFE